MGLEKKLVEWLRNNLPCGPVVELGLGDDAAVLKRFAGDQVVTTDLLSDRVDFLIDEVTPEQVGHKALGVNLSDLAAMAARPQAAFVSLLLPSEGSASQSALDLAIGLYRGMLPMAEQFDVTIAGGDTNTWDGPLAISITAIGETTKHGPLTRKGGMPGDRLLVTGQLGGSILGRHLEVEPRVSEALLLHDRHKLHAGIDISDGLGIDTSRLAEASGLGAVLDLAQLPLSEASNRLSQQDGRSPIDHALGDGEDFELLFAVPHVEAERLLHDQPLAVTITCIGELTSQLGLWKRDVAGEHTPLEPRGFQHGGEC